MTKQIPSPDVVFPNEYKTSCFIKNVVTAPNIIIGDYTYYDDTVDPAGFEKTMCCSIIRNSVTGLLLENSVRLRRA